MQIFIKTTRGNTITLGIEGSDTLDVVKTKIKDIYECSLDASDIHWELVPKPETSMHKRMKIDLSSSVFKMQLLFIRTTTGKIITLEVRGSDTFDLVKEKMKNIAYQCNLKNCSCSSPIITELLIKTTTGKTITVEEGSEILDFVKAKIKDIAHECSIYSCSCFRFNITEKLLLVRTTTGKTKILEVIRGSDTFDAVKTKIKDSDNCDISHWELISKPAGWGPGLMPIFVRIPNGSGKTITVSVEPANTINDLKYVISLNEGIDMSKQNLFFAGMSLEMDHTLEHYNIDEGSTLDLVLNGEGERERGPMQIFVETTDGRKIPLKLGAGICLIKEVKELIKNMTGIRMDQYMLVYDGEELEDARNLQSCYIQEKATLRLVDDAFMKRRVWMRIHIQIAVTHKTIHLDVESTDTIQAVKSKIQAQEDIPKSQQVLFLPSKRLQENTFTLAECYIPNESTLYLAQSLGDKVTT